MGMKFVTVLADEEIFTFKTFVMSPHSREMIPTMVAKELNHSYNEKLISSLFSLVDKPKHY